MNFHWNKNGGERGRGRLKAGLKMRTTALALEPRIMFDAAALTTAAGLTHSQPSGNPGMVSASDFTIHTVDAQPAEVQPVPAPDTHAVAADNHTAASDASHLTAPASQTTEQAQQREVVFIDSAVPNYRQLVDGAKPGTLVFVLDAKSDGVQQMADIIAANKLQDLSAIQIVSHANPGEIRLGSTDLGQGNLQNHTAALAAMGAALSPDGDILFWGCDIAAGPEGQQFLSDLAAITGADISASTDATGGAARGGDWILESATGLIEARAPFADATLDSYVPILNDPASNEQASVALSHQMGMSGVYGAGSESLGTIRLFAGNTVVGDAVELNNPDLLTISGNTALFSRLGTNFGGDGKSNFALPDVSASTLIGAGESPGLTPHDYYVGEIAGSNVLTLTAQNWPGNLPVDNLQESLTVRYVINLYGIYPTPDGNGSRLDYIGAVTPYAGGYGEAPGGTMFAEGQLLPIAEYDALFNLIGTTYGGDGQSTFALPDLRGRTIMGSGSFGGDSYVVGQQRGSESIDITNTNIPVSLHGGGQPVSTIQPSLVMTYIIALGGIYPTHGDGPGGDSDTLSTDTPYLGEVMAFAGDFVPKGWAQAAGQLLPINQNQALWSLLGTTYGGDGRTTFALPDLRGKIVVGTGDGKVLGERTLSQTLTLTASEVPNPLRAVQSTTLTTDVDRDGVIDPGDTVTTTVTISNTSTLAVDNVSFGENLSGMSFVPGSVKVAGVANATADIGGFAVTGSLAGSASVTVTYDAVVSAQNNQRIVNPQNFGVVDSSGFEPGATNWDTIALDSLTIGDKIYNDANFNGVFDTGDTGINGVSLSLFADSNNDNIADSPTALATVSSSGAGVPSGTYSFTGLAPGNYIVRVNAGNFETGGALLTYLTAAAPAAADPDGNVNNDNDGLAASGGTVRTKSITLAYNSEPTNDGDTDADTNLTLDIGIVHNRPPVVDFDANDSATTAGIFITSFTEDAAAVSIVDSDVSITDPDSTTLLSGVVTLTNYVSGQDVLAFTANANTGDIASSFNTTTGALTLSSVAGNATLAQWAAALKATTYSNSSHNPNTADRTINVVLNDGRNFGNLSTSVSTTVHVLARNDAPVASDSAVTTLEDTGYVFKLSDFVSSDLDSPANAVTNIVISAIAGGGTLKNDGRAFAGGTVSAADIAASKLSFTPGANGNGSNYASFAFRVQDDGGTVNGAADTSLATAQMQIDVTPVNDAPAGADKTITTNEDAVYTFSAADFGFSDAADAAGSAGVNALLVVKIASISGAGTLANNGSAVNAGDFVTVADITGGKLKFTPAANANGNGYASFTFQVQDDGGTSNGGADLDQTSNTITVDVTAVNDAPAGADRTVTANEDTAYTFTAADFGFTDPTDAGASGGANALAAVQIVSLPVAGELTINGGGIVTANALISIADINAGKLKFMPGPNANGNSYSGFSFQVQDNGGTASGGVNLDAAANTITIDVAAINDAPAVSFDRSQYANNTPVAIADFATATSTIVVSGANPYLLDVNLQTLIRHASSWDLDITLTSPSGTVVTITTDNGLSLPDVFNGTIWDDSANPGGQAPYTINNGLVTDQGYVTNIRPPRLVPEGALGAFIGENPNGTWTLTVTDDQLGLAGTLDGWSLDLATLTAAPTTRTQTVSNNTPVTIPSTGLLNVVTSTIAISGASSKLLDLNAQTFITHSFAGDLVITLTSPSGTVVTLTSKNGAGADNIFNGTVWDDNGAIAATDKVYTTLVPAASLIPEEAMAAFVGENPNGTWTLTVADQSQLDGGTLNSWSLTVESYDPSSAAVTFTEVSGPDTGANAISFVSAGTNLSDVDSSTLANLKVAISAASVADGDSLRFGATVIDLTGTTASGEVTAGGSVFGYAVADASGTRTVSFTSLNGTGGAATRQALADYEALLDGLKYNNSSDTPVVGSTRSFGVTVNDGALDSSVAGFTVTLAAANDPPVLTNLGPSVTVLEQTATRLDGDVILSDVELDLPSGANGDYSGSSLSVARSGGASTQDSFGFDVTGASFTVSGGDLQAGGLTFANFTNTSGTLTIAFTGSAVAATKALVADVTRHIAYTNSSDNPPASLGIAYTFNDGNGGAQGFGGAKTTTATLTVDVTGINDAPTGADSSVAAFEDGIYTFAASDFGLSDGDGNALGAVKLATLPATGRLIYNGIDARTGQSVTAADIALGRLIYLPAVNANGAGLATFKFQVKDDGGIANGGVDTDPAQYVMTVNVTAVSDAPSGTDKTVTVGEDGSRSFSAADFGFSDPNDGTPDNFSAVTITTLPLAGTLKLGAGNVSAGQSIAVGDLGTLVFTPAADGNGPAYASFTFQVQDSGSAANGGVTLDATSNTITIDVTPANDGPSAATPASYAATEQTVLSLKNNALSVGDSDNAGGVETATLSVTQGILSITAGDSGVSVANSGSSSVSVSGTIAQINALLHSGGTGTVDYLNSSDTPSASATLTLAINDNGNSGTGGALTASATTAIAIAAVNDAPENHLPASLSASLNGATPFTGLAVGDVDAGGGNLTVTLAVDHGTLNIKASSGVAVGANNTASVTLTGTVADLNAALAAVNGVVYAPANNYLGADTLHVTTSDNGNSGSGGAKSDSDTVAITVASLTATQTVALAIDVDGDGIADPGDTLNITTAITNGGGSDATNIALIEKLTGLTLVPGAVNVSPLAFDDSYDAIGNTQLVVGEAAPSTPANVVSGSLFSNDVEFLGDTFTLTSIAGNAGAAALSGGAATTTTAHGAVTVNADGTFHYTPTAGFSGGTDTFTYTISDKGLDGIAGNGDDLTGTATVTIAVADRIWYVKNDSAAGGGGTSTNPFDTLAEAQSASLAGDTIYVFNGNNTTAGQNTGIVLKANQHLIGEGVALTASGTFNGVANPILKAAGSKAHIGNSGGDGVSVTNISGVQIRGFDIAGSQNAIDVTTNGGNSGGVEIADNTISAAGAEGIDVNGGGTGSLIVSIHDNTVSANGTGIDIAKTQGTLTITAFDDNVVTGTSLSNGISVSGAIFDATPGGAFQTVSGGNTTIGSSSNGVGTGGLVLTDVFGDLSFTDLDIFNDAGTGLQASSNGNFNGATGSGFRIGVTGATGTITTAHGPALELSVVTGALNLASISSTNSGSTAVTLIFVQGTITIGGGSITNASTGFVIQAGTADITYNGSITDDTGTLVSVSSTTGGTKTFGGAISDGNDGDGSGISLSGNSNSNIVFAGGLTLATGGNTAFTATNNSNTTLTVTGAANTIATTTATALNIVNTTIGAANVTFRSISSGSATNSSATGIILDTTGANGGLRVTGFDGTDAGTDPDAGSGGTIQHKTGADGETTTGNGIYLNNTSNVRLAGMQLNDFQNSAIRGFGVTGFSLEDSVIGGVVGDNVAVIEGAIAFGDVLGAGTTGLSGNSLIDNVNISGSIEHQVEVYKQTGTMSLTISNSNIHDNSVAGGSDGIQMEFRGNAQAFINIDTNQFSNNKSQAIQIAALESSNIQATIQSNTITKGTQGNDGIVLSNGGDSQLTAMIGGPAAGDGNSISGFGGASIFVGQAPGQGTAQSLLQVTIQHNTVISPADATNHAIEALLSSLSGQVSQTRLLIDSNTVTYLSGSARAILVDAPDAGRTPEFYATVTNNTVNASNVDAVTMISVAARNGAIGHSDIRGNTVNFTGGSTASGINVREASGGSNELARGASASNDSAIVLTANNPRSTTTVIPGASSIPVVENNTILLPATPTQPSLPLVFAPGGVEAPDAGDVSSDTISDTASDEAITGGDAIASAPSSSDGSGFIEMHLSQYELDAMVAAAKLRWAAAGLSQEQIAALDSVAFSVTEFSGFTLGSYSTLGIRLDSDAAGLGWYIDSNPADDAEFGHALGDTRLQTDPDQIPAGHLDLLTTVMHEMGHELGLSDSYVLTARDSLMFGYLVTGERRLPGRGQANGAVAGSLTEEEFLAPPIASNLTIPAGKTVTVQFQTTVNPQTNQFIVDATSQVDPLSNFISNIVTTAVDSLTLGDRIFNDANADGTFDSGSENGIANVGLTLYADDGDIAGSFDAHDTAIATAVTAPDGTYSFAGLAPGDYILQVDQANFDRGGVLSDKTVTGTGVDPDGNADNDSNGIAAAGNGVVTLPITLDYNSETTAGTGNDTNNTLDIGFAHINLAPSGADKTVTTNEDTAYVFTAADFGFRDSDANALAAVKIASLPADGKLTDDGEGVTADQFISIADITAGKLRFRPAADANGNGYASFTFQVQDNGTGANLDLSPNTFTVNVTPVNDAPVAADDSYTTSLEVPLVVALDSAGVLANDSDIDTAASSLTAVKLTDPSHGSLTFNADGTFSYTPDTGFAGLDSFTYRTTDGSLNSNTATVTITVKASPLTSNDDGYATNEDIALTVDAAGGVLANDTDSSTGVTLTATVVTGPAHGALTLNTDGSFTYTPDVDYSGRDSFTYQVDDGAFQSVSSVALTITSVNDAPLLDAAKTPVLVTVNEDAGGPVDGVAGGTLVSSLVDLPGGGGFDNVSDVDAGPVTGIALTAAATADGAWFYSTDAGAHWTAVGSVSNTSALLLAANAGTRLYFQPNADFNGTLTGAITFRAWDQSNGAGLAGSKADVSVSGGTTPYSSATDTANITVTAVADIAGDALTTNEDTAIAANVITGTNGATADTFEGAAVLTAVTQGSNGAVSFTAAGAVTYTPKADFNGTDSFTYTVTSGGVTETTTVDVTVTAVADIAGDSLTTNEDTAVTANVITGTNGATADTFEGAAVLTSVTQGSNGAVSFTAAGAVTYTPKADFNGTDSFTYTVTSGGVTETTTVDVTVTAVADIAGDSLTTNEDTAITANVITGTNGATADTFEGTAVLTSVTQGANGAVSFTAAGAVTYTPKADFNGTDSFTYTVTSGGVTETTTVDVTVAAVADIAGDSLTTNEDTAVTANVITGTNGATADTFEGTAVLTSVTQGANGAVSFTAAGAVTYTPKADFNGTDSFTYTVTSGGVTETTTVDVTVNAVADIAGDTLTTNEDTAITANVITGTNGATADTFEGTAVLTSVTQGTNGAVSFTAAGAVTYTPKADFNGTDSFTYTVTSGGVTETTTVDVTVAAVADIAGDSLTTNEDTAITANVITGTNGATADTFEGTAVLTSVTQGANGAVSFTAAGAVTYTPKADFNGTDSFTYTVTSGGVTETTTVDVTVNAVADIAGDSLTTNEDTAITANVITGTNGATADTFEGTAVLTSVTQGANGAVSFTAAGAVTYTPKADFNGTDSFTYTVTSGGVTETTTVDVTVTAVADIAGDSLTTNEDTAITANVITGTNGATADTFEGAAVLTSVTQGSNGAVSFTAAGAVTYTPNLNFNGTDSFTYTVTSGGVTETATVDVTVTAVDDPPVFVDLDAVQTYVEDAGRITLDGDATIFDPEVGPSDSFDGATLILSRRGGANADDVFDASVFGGTVRLEEGQVLTTINDPNLGLLDLVIGFYSNGEGTLAITFNANSTGALVDALLQSLTYANSNESPTGPITIDYVFNDGLEGRGSLTLGLSAVNDPPVLDAVAPVAAYAPDGTAQTLSPDLLVGDPDSATLAGASVTIADFISGDTLGVDVGVTGIAASYDSATGVLTLSGAGTLAEYQQVLASVTYASSLADPTNGGSTPNRTIQWSVNDGESANNLSQTQTTTVYFVPEADLDGSAAGLDFSTAFTENGSAIAVVDSDVTLVPGTYGISSATVVLTNAQAGDDLSIGTLAAGVSADVDSSVAGQITISLNGNGSPAAYQAALSAIRFVNTSENPSTVTRDISVTLSDGNMSSTVAHTSIAVTAVNDAPSGADNTITVAEDGAITFTAADFGFSDAAEDNALLAVKIIVVPGAGALSNDGIAVQAGDSVLAADIAAGKLIFAPAANANGAGYAAFRFQVQDDGGTADGGADLDPSAGTITIDVTSVNDAPAGAGTTVTTLEDTAYVFAGSDFGFSDADDAPANGFLAVKITTLPGAGTLSNDGVALVAGSFVTKADIDAGKLVFTPAADANGAGYASLTFQVQDDGGTADGGADLDPSAGTITIDVTSVNDAPSGADTTVTTLEDAAYTFTAADFGFGDSIDAASTAGSDALLAVKIATLPAAGTLSNNGVAVTAGDVVSKADIDAGLLTFAPAANANGAGYASLTFQVQDNGGTADGGVDLDASANTVTINVTSVNDAPQGTDKTVTVNEDTAYVFTAGDFGFGDAIDAASTAGSDALLTVKIATLPAAGTLSNNGVAVTAGDVIAKADIDAGLLIFAPAANANGAGYASLTFQVQDNGGTANGGVDLDPSAKTITVDVTSVNDAPSGADKTVTTLEDTAYTFTSGDFGFGDAGDAPADALLAVKIAALPGAGTLSLNGVAVTAGSFVSKSDIDAGLLTFAPAADANGAGYASLTFQVQDNGGTADGGADLASINTITVDVTSVNDAPSGVDTTVTMLEDAAYTFTAADFGFGDATDAGSSAGSDAFLAVKITTLPGAGTLSLNGVAVTSGAFVAKADIDAGLLTFTPGTDANGAGYASLTFQVQDNGGTANGGADLDPSANSITVNVTSVNDAPSGADKTVTTLEDTAYIFTAADFGFGDATDAAAAGSDAFLAVKITTLPGAGTLSLNGVAVTAGASVAKADIDAGLLTFAPAADANGAGYASLTFQVQDNGGTANGGADLDPSAKTITVNVTSVNDAPSGADKTVTTLEGAGYTFTAADFGFGDSIDATSTAGSDALLAVKIATLPGAGTLSLNGVAVTSGAFVAKADIDAGLLTFTPATDANGASYASLTFQVQDNGGTVNGGADIDASAKTIIVNVTSVNDAPSGADKTVTTLEDTAYTFTAADFGFGDTTDAASTAGANTLLAVKITTLPGAGTLSNNGVALTSGAFVSKADIDAGLLTFAPGTDANGVGYASLTFQVQDNGGTVNGGADIDASAKTITVNVTSVNDAPSGADRTVTTLEDAAYTFTAADFGFSDATDAASTAGANTLLAVKITTLPGAGTLINNGVVLTSGAFVSKADIDAGRLTFAPSTDANGAGYARLTFQVQDNGGTGNGGVDLDASANSITINVTSVNDAPAGVDKTVTTLEDTAYIFTAADFGFGDPGDAGSNAGADALDAVRIATLPGNGTLTDNGVAVTAGAFVSKADIDAGLLVFTPAANANGNGYASFAFSLRDNGGTGNGGADLGLAGVVTLDVTAVNDAPQSSDRDVTLPEARAGETFSVTLPDGLFADIDADALTLSMQGLPDGLSFDAATRTLSGVPTSLAVGDDVLTLTATDPSGAIAQRSLALLVRPAFFVAPADTAPDPDNVGGAGAPPATGGVPPGQGFVPNNGGDGDGDGGANNFPPLDIQGGGTAAYILIDPTATGGADAFIQAGDVPLFGDFAADAAGRFGLRLPDGLFVTNDFSTAVQVFAEDGGPLPDWLDFDPATGSFSITGDVPAGTEEVTVQVIARNSSGQEVMVRYTLHLPRAAALAPVHHADLADHAGDHGPSSPVPAAPGDFPLPAAFPVGKPPLSKFIKAASSQGQWSGSRSLLAELAGLMAQRDNKDAPVPHPGHRHDLPTPSRQIPS